MNRAQRLLIVYTRLLRKQTINKYELANELEVNERTVQRDIDDIRAFLSDTNEHLYRQEVKYDYQQHAYFLQNNEVKKNSSSFHKILMNLYSLSPVMEKEIYDLCKSLIYKYFAFDSNALVERLNTFRITNGSTDYALLQDLEYFIKTSTIITIITQTNTFTEIFPLSLYYHYRGYRLSYFDGNNEKQLDISEIIEVHPTKDKVANTFHHHVTLEMTMDLFRELKEVYSIEVIELFQHDKVIATFDMTMHEAVSICLLHSPYVRLISSADNNILFSHLLRLNSVYFNQQIKTKDGELPNED